MKKTKNNTASRKSRLDFKRELKEIKNRTDPLTDEEITKLWNLLYKDKK